VRDVCYEQGLSLPIRSPQFMVVNTSAVPASVLLLRNRGDGGRRSEGSEHPVEVICVFVLRYLFQAYGRVKNGSLC
jgi:hypothetical protein